MRPLLVLLLCISAFAQSQKQPAPNKQSPQEEVQKTGTNQPVPDARQQKPEAVVTQARPIESQVHADTPKQNDWPQTIKEISDGLLVVFTGVLAYVGYQQWKTLRQHEQWMKQNVAIAKDTADAANKNAEAARLNANAAVNAVRPWVSISGFYNSGVFSFSAVNYGNTPAEIISYSANIKFVDKVENLALPPEYKNWKQPSFALLSPGGTSDGAMLELETYNTNAIAVLDPKKPIFVFYFRVLYKNPINSSDPFVTNHESRMCFWYRAKGGQFPRVGGPQDYNKHT
jgi:hypothetical protein